MTRTLERPRRPSRSRSGRQPPRPARQAFGPRYGPPPPPRRSPRTAARRLARERMRRRRRRAMLLTLFLAVIGLVAVDFARGDPFVRARTVEAQPTSPTTAPETQAPTQTPSPEAALPTPAPAPVTYPQHGPGTFALAPGLSPVFGYAGTLRRYRVMVEHGTGQDAAAFAAASESVLGDGRSWIAGRDVRFQRVSDATFDFTLLLATPGTTDQLCARDGLRTNSFTSCRVSSHQVVINLARWLTAIKDYGAPVEVYQAYAINHEVGHELGHGHESCPGPGRLAPLMQQQTFGLDGCVANAWPYVNGKRYRGPPNSAR